MSLAKSGAIANCCTPNALMTLQEYLQDYASPDVRTKGAAMILREMGTIVNEKVRRLALENLDAIVAGQRDFRF
jgi:2-iminoacetate synthase